MFKLLAHSLLIFVSVGIFCVSSGTALESMGGESVQASGPAASTVIQPPFFKAEEELRKSYTVFVDSLDTMKIAKEYPKAIQNLLSADPERQTIGLATLSASREVEVIPWMVPYLDSPNHSVKIWAGAYLEQLVSSNILKQRRNMAVLDRVVINPPRPEDVDFRPLAWVVHRMLQKPDDGSTHAYAATMIGYIGLREFEPELRQLLKSMHPAVSNKAKYALETLGLEQRQR